MTRSDFSMIEGNVIFEKRSHKAPFKVHCMALSPHSDFIAIGSMTGDVVVKRTSWKQIWKMNVLQVGRMGHVMQKNSTLSCLEFSPTGELLAAGTNDGHIHIIDVESGNYKHSSRVGDDNTALNIIRLRWCHHCPNDMSTGGTVKYINDIIREVDDEKRTIQPPRLPGQCSLYDTCIEMSGQKPDVAREDIAFAFQMLEEVMDSSYIKADDGAEDQLESTFISNQKFRQSYYNTVLLVTRDDFVVTLLAGGVFPFANLDINKHCANLNLAGVFQYDAFYSRHTGGLTVTATTTGPRPHFSEDNYKGLGRPKCSNQARQNHTHIFNFKINLDERIWELALRYVRIVFGFSLLCITYETCQKDWHSQVAALQNRFVTGMSNIRIGELLIDMLLSGTSEPAGEAFLERGMGKEGLTAIKDFCDKHLIELARVLRGQHMSSVRNLAFQIEEFVSIAKRIMSNAFYTQRRNECLETSFFHHPRSAVLQYSPDNQVLIRLQLDVARLEYKNKQLNLACSVMLQELSHLVKWMQTLKPFARVTKPNVLIGYKRLDIKMIMRYITRNFVVDPEWRKKYEDVMFDIEKHAESLKQEEENEGFDEKEFYEKAKKDAERIYKEYREKLRAMRIDAVVPEEPARKTEETSAAAPAAAPAAPFVEPKCSDTPSPPTDPRTVEPRVDLDRVGSFFTPVLSDKALDILPFAGNILEGIDPPECPKTAKNLDHMSRKMSMASSLQAMLYSIVGSVNALCTSNIVNFDIAWSFEVDSAPDHQGFADFKITSSRVDYHDGVHFIIPYDNNIVRRAITTVAISKKVFKTISLIPPLTAAQRGEINLEGELYPHGTSLIIGPNNVVISEGQGRFEATDHKEEYVEQGQEMEIDENVPEPSSGELKIEVDTEQHKNVYDKLVSFEAGFPLHNFEYLVVGNFERSDGVPGIMRRLMKWERVDNRFVVHNDSWGATEVMEWASISPTALRGAFLHDNGSRVTIFSTTDTNQYATTAPLVPAALQPTSSTQTNHLKEVSNAEVGSTTYRDFQARRERFRRTLPTNMGQITNAQRIRLYLDEVRDEEQQEFDYEALVF